AVARPVPIPNTAVKHCRADGSGFIDSARVGRRQIFQKSRDKNLSRLFCFEASELKSSLRQWRSINQAAAETSHTLFCTPKRFQRRFGLAGSAHHCPSTMKRYS